MTDLDAAVAKSTSANPPPVVIFAEGVSVSYEVLRAGERKGLRRRPAIVDALRGVSFVVREGGSLGVVGHNGAGKTTLVRALSGEIGCTGGRVLVRSRPTSVSVSSALQPNLTGRRNIELGLLAIGFKPAEVIERIEVVAEYAEVGPFIDMPLRTYSTGMRGRLRFAISTERRPDILLLDEALATGDKHFRDKSMERVAAIKEAAGAIVVVSHSSSEIAQTCDTAIWLHDGRVQAAGPAEEVAMAFEDSRMKAKRDNIR